jgi:hypothetical protein
VLNPINGQVVITSSTRRDHSFVLDPDVPELANLRNNVLEALLLDHIEAYRATTEGVGIKGLQLFDDEDPLVMFGIVRAARADTIIETIETIYRIAPQLRTQFDIAAADVCSENMDNRLSRYDAIFNALSTVSKREHELNLLPATVIPLPPMRQDQIAEASHNRL